MQQLITPQDEQEIKGRLRNRISDISTKKYELDDPSYSKARVLEDINDKKSEMNRETAKTKDNHQDYLRKLQDLEKKRVAIQDKVDRKTQQFQELERKHNHEEDKFRELERLHSTAEEDNKRQREDLLRFGEETNKKVSELDTKLNGVIRLREHEEDNAKFELESVENEFALICTEMEKEFGDKFKDIEHKIRVLDSEKARGQQKLTELSDRIKNLHRDTERKAKHVIDGVREEARRDLEDKKKEAEARVRGVEEAIRKQKEQNNDKLRELQDCERNTRNKQMNIQNEMQRIRMDLERYMKENGQLKQLADDLGKNLGIRQSELSRVQMEYKMLEDRKFDLEDIIDKDMYTMEEKIKRERDDIDLEKEANKKQLADYDAELRIRRDEYDELRGKYDALMGRLHNGLENTLNNEISQYHNSDYGSNKRSRNRSGYTKSKYGADEDSVY